MKVIERLSLIDRIGRELQSRMSYGEIDTYLKAHGVDIKKPTSGVNSKWVYSKELLADESEDLIIRIADELEVPHNHVVADSTKTLEATFWEPFHSISSSFSATYRHSRALRGSYRRRSENMEYLPLSRMSILNQLASGWTRLKPVSTQWMHLRQS